MTNHPSYISDGVIFLIHYSEFKNMEVINLYNNEKLGFVCDLEICTSTGEISAVIVPDKTKLFCSIKKGGLRIPWNKISGIGKNLILVNVICNE